MGQSVTPSDHSGKGDNCLGDRVEKGDNWRGTRVEKGDNWLEEVILFPIITWISDLASKWDIFAINGTNLGRYSIIFLFNFAWGAKMNRKVILKTPNLAQLVAKSEMLDHDMSARDGRFGSKVGQIGPKWDKSGAFSDQISVHLARWRQTH